MKKIYPKKLVAGDGVRVIAPSRSLSIISEEIQAVAKKRFSALGLNLSFGKHVNEKDDFLSSSIASRVSDFHDAFKDKDIKAIISVLGGFNSNQLLKYLDWNLIRNNPKIFCGFSDITALNNALFAKTGLISYSGPHYSTFGQESYFDYTLNYFKKCLFSENKLAIVPSKSWSDDAWYKNQKERNLIKNEGFLTITPGVTSGTIVGGNLCTLNLLQGTEYFPRLNNAVVFIEDDSESLPHTFDRDLQSLVHLPKFKKVKGIVIGRFQKASSMTYDLLLKIIKTKKQLTKLPTVANVDFGHTDPKITFPIGGEVHIVAKKTVASITIIKH